MASGPDLHIGSRPDARSRLTAVSKILYTGDIGAALGLDYREVPDFDAHKEHMDGFHRRYMSSTAAFQAWAKMVRGLDIEIIAPQHGAFFRGKKMVAHFRMIASASFSILAATATRSRSGRPVNTAARLA